MAVKNSMARIIDPATLLLTVRGLKEMFNSVLGVENFSLQFHNNWKQGLRASKKTGTDYPHGGFKITTLNVTENNLKNMMRVGTGDGVVAGANNNAVIQRSFLVAALLNCEVEIKFQDVQEAMMFSAAASIFLSCGMLSFQVAYGRNTWSCEVKLSGGGHSMPMPMIDDLNEGSTPGTAAVSFSLDVTTKIGFIRDVSKINNYGKVQFNAAVSGTPDAQELEALYEETAGEQYALSAEQAAQLRRSMSVVDRLMRGVK